MSKSEIQREIQRANAVAMAAERGQVSPQAARRAMKAIKAAKRKEARQLDNE